MIVMGLQTSRNDERFTSTCTTRAIAVFAGPEITGTVVFRKSEPKTEGCLVEANLSGLAKGKHGFHIHRYGNLLNNCKAACEHYNPCGTVHGGPDSEHHHVGDLGNICANSAGIATLRMHFPYIFLSGPCSVVGRSVVIHEDADDLGKGGVAGSKERQESLKTGNAGKRLACAVIGIAAEIET